MGIGRYEALDWFLAVYFRSLHRVFISVSRGILVVYIFHLKSSHGPVSAQVALNLNSSQRSSISLQIQHGVNETIQF